MRKANDVVEKFILPWLDEHHPHAELVIMAGSYGRSMKEGKYAPLASSDIDLVIVYSDLKNGGFKCATQSFTQEDVGSKLGEGKGIMMVDTNVHDLASLHYHDKIVREHTHMAFINVMLDEGYVVRDRLGIGAIMQEKAKKFLAEGPTLTPAPQFAAELERLKTYRRDIAAADNSEEKRFLGALSLINVCEYVLGLNRYWRSGSNQAYRSLSREYPELTEEMTQAFSSLIRGGDDKKALALFDKLIAQGEEKLPTLPVQASEKPFPTAQFVSAADNAQSRDLFLKFMTEHLAEALETSKKRGELAHLENLSATINFIKSNIELQDPQSAPTAGKAAMHYLSMKSPDMMPVVLQMLDEGHTKPLHDIAEKSLAHMGGLQYNRIDNIYADDLARINATKPDAAKMKHRFKTGFTS